jgi:peroxiredoxin
VKRQTLSLMVVAVVVLLVLVFEGHRNRLSSRSAVSGNGKGQTAPDFTMKSLEGKPVRLSDLRGKAVVLNFWATWCEPCKIEMPWFVGFQKQYGANGLQVVGVSMGDDSPDEVAKFAKTMGVNYLILAGTDKEREPVADLYGGIQFLPVTVYIDREGKIVDKIFGLKGRAEIEDSIKKALATGSVAQK